MLGEQVSSCDVRISSPMILHGLAMKGGKSLGERMKTANWISETESHHNVSPRSQRRCLRLEIWIFCFVVRAKVCITHLQV